MKSNIFLICSERSGSNLVTKIFNAHPEISGPSPAHLFRALSLKENSKHYQNKDNLVRDISDLWNLKMSDWLYSWNDSDFKDDRTPYELIAKIYRNEANLRGKSISFIKEVKTYKLFDEILLSFPDSKFVYSVRDPRDMALSWSKDPVLRGDIVRASKTWYEDQKETLSLLLKYSDRIAFLRYEDLLTDPENTLRKVCKKIGVSFHEDMLRHTSRSEESKQLTTASWVNVGKPIMKDNFFKFQNELAAQQIEYIEQKCGQLMEVFGYKLITERATWQPFNELEMNLEKQERHEKSEYQYVPETEKLKRTQWMKQFELIKGRV
jgi:hypothetical protein